MQKTKLIFLRHADTQKDPTLNAALWVLSEQGIKQAQDVSLLPEMQEAACIYVSEEQKTALTAAPLASKLGKELCVKASFNEVKRGDAFLTKEAFEAEKDKQLIDLDYHAFGGESGYEALARFTEGVAEVIKEHQGKTVLIVTHGTVLNMYFAECLHVLDQLPERWRKTGFCAYGCVEDGVVTKDIVA